MFFSTNKEKGRAGLSMAIAYFGSNGYTVSIPLNDTQDYDLVIEKDNEFKKVQCKSTGSKNRSGTYRVKLNSWGGANGGTYYGTVKDSSADILFVLVENGDKYVIPVTDIDNVGQLTVNNYEKYKVDF